MKIAFLVLTMMIAAGTKAQTAMQFTGDDCNGNPVDLFADLDAGKAVFLHFYMPDCGACPPVAADIMEMSYNIMADFPDMIKGYAFPFQNSTTCAYSASWVTDNHVEMYVPMDSGALQVAYYGGFGMPTVVLLGGADHRVMFSTLSYITSDTTIMRDSILNLFGAPLDIASEINGEKIKLFPNPADASVQIESTFSGEDVQYMITDVAGNIKYTSHADHVGFSENNKISTAGWPPGIYFLKMYSASGVNTQKFIVQH